MKQTPKFKTSIKILFIVILIGLVVGNCEFSEMKYNPVGPGIIWSTF